MTILLTIIFVLLGFAVGSFLNVCIDRLPSRKSLVSPPSHCDNCERRLSVMELIPVLSYLWLRGRCRHCQAPIPRRVLLVEILSGVIFFLAYWRFVIIPDSADYAAFALTAFWGCIFLLVIFIDWEKQLILNRITYPAAVIALVVLGFDSVFPGAGILANLDLVPQPSVLSGIIGGAIGFVFFLIVFLVSRGGIGIGDIKLVGLIGLVTGVPLFIVALLLGIFIGGLVAIVILLLKKKGRKDVIPYGTFLGIGPIITLLWGNEIFTWYMGLF